MPHCLLHSALNRTGNIGHGGLVCLCQGLKLLLPGVEFAATLGFVFCCQGLNLLLPGVELAAPWGLVCCGEGLSLLLPKVEFAAAMGLSLLLQVQSN